MRRGRQEELGFATVREALDLRTVNDLKQLLALLPTAERPTRKGDLIALIERQLAGDGLRELWERLDDLQQKAVAETIYSESPVFDAARFRAKYGAAPVSGEEIDEWDDEEIDEWDDEEIDECDYIETQGLLRLFFYSDDRHSSSSSAILPDDLRARLSQFASRPESLRLRGEDELPEFVEDVVDQIPLVRRDTEHAAQQDLFTMLRLVDKGKVSVSDKTFQPSLASMQEIASLLRDGDFYGQQWKMENWEQEAGPIKAFAWPMLAQAGRLVEPHGKKLALSKAGRNAIAAPAAETLKLIWQRWMKSNLLDEFNRVCGIKGQQGKGKRAMTATEGRRAAIAEALKQCPMDKWVKFDDFSRFMRAAGITFEVTREPWGLFIADARYGSLGHEGYHDWNILQSRYLMAFLFEYAATLGLIDVAYVDPVDARDDYRNLWGTDELAYLSQYDGLTYLRLNPLGAYCLDLTDKYAPGRVEAKPSITALPSLQINIGGEFSPGESMLLEAYAEKESDKVWRLSREKALSAVENGNQIEELREFLQARDEQPLPETVEGFIVTTDRQARALKNTGAALLIECADAEIAGLIASHERTKKLCLRAGERHLVVKVDAEEQFRKAVHLLGYGMPRV